MRKKIWILMVICTLLIQSLCQSVYGTTGGSGNIDGGGGGMGSGINGSFWNGGDDGVRVTVVRAEDHKIVTTPIDITNITPNNAILHFGKVSKLHYTNGAVLKIVQGNYTSIKPAIAMPRIVSTEGKMNIAAIKKYFCSEYVVKRIAEVTGMDYDVLIGGEYKLLLEPLAYFMFEGSYVVTSATEAALFNITTKGTLYKRMQSLTHKNLPLAMFLETADLGYKAWSGTKNSLVTDMDIIEQLGLGVVRFTEKPEELEISDFDYEYRVDTDVITAVTVEGGQSDPDNPVEVEFDICGVTYTVSNVYYPKGSSQVAYVKWRTPKEEQEIEIDVTVRGPGRAAKSVIYAKITDLNKNPPPNPVADDRNDSFEQVKITDKAEKTKLIWTIWRPRWHSVWYKHGKGENSYWCDHGYWVFDLDSYQASMQAEMQIYCDDKNPTATGRTMKSGYGIKEKVTGKVSTNQRSAVTDVQTALSYFPEFAYDTYWRLLEKTGDEFVFQKNRYSTYNERTHFTPIWFPDGKYEVYTYVFDVWTPAGMLSLNLKDDLSISGSLWDDWHIAPKN